jgi:hypothetical protein
MAGLERRPCHQELPLPALMHCTRLAHMAPNALSQARAAPAALMAPWLLRHGTQSLLLQRKLTATLVRDGHCLVSGIARKQLLREFCIAYHLFAPLTRTHRTSLLSSLLS